MTEYTNTTKLMTELTNKVLEGSIVTAKYEQYQRVVVPYDLTKVYDYWVKWGTLYIQLDKSGAIVSFEMGEITDADDFKRPAETSIEESNGSEYDNLEDFWEWHSMTKEEQIELIRSKKENVDYDSDDSTIVAIDNMVDLINETEKFDKEGLTAEEVRKKKIQEAVKKNTQEAHELLTKAMEAVGATLCEEEEHKVAEEIHEFVGEEECSDCKRTETELDSNDIELKGEGKYAICLDCEDERISHMEDDCGECGDRVGSHAANVGTIGFPICYSCDVNGKNEEEYEKEYQEKRQAEADKLNMTIEELEEAEEDYRQVLEEARYDN